MALKHKAAGMTSANAIYISLVVQGSSFETVMVKLKAFCYINRDTGRYRELIWLVDLIALETGTWEGTNLYAQTCADGHTCCHHDGPPFGTVTTRGDRRRRARTGFTSCSNSSSFFRALRGPLRSRITSEHGTTAANKPTRLDSRRRKTERIDAKR